MTGKDGRRTSATKQVWYSHDLIANEALAFIKANRGRPFFCYVPFTIPHVAIQVPEDSLAQYRGKWPDPPYDGSKGYFPHPSPRAGYAAMVSRMDRDVGRIMDLLDTLNLKEKTLVVFTSDNGPTFNGGSDSAFFASAGPLRGLKTMVYEGGIRVPFIARWPGKIEPGSISHHVSAFWDFFPTCCDLLGVKALEPLDGISMLPALTGQPGQQQHDYLYWELNGQQALRVGNYKAVRRKRGPIELYDLQNDIGEQRDLAANRPAIVAKMKRLFESVRNESRVFPLVGPKNWDQYHSLHAFLPLECAEGRLQFDPFIFPRFSVSVRGSLVELSKLHSPGWGKLIHIDPD